MGRHAIDLTGQRFGNLVVLRRQGSAEGGQVIWQCRCDCGGGHSVLGQSLRRGLSQRCPACVKAGRKVDLPACGGVTIVRLWFYMHGTTGGFATARDLETGELLVHSNWSRKPLGSTPWQAYGPLRYVLRQLVRIGRAKPKPAEQSIERWCKQNAIRLQEPSWITGRPQLDALWEMCLASGKGPTMVEVDRGADDRRHTAAMLPDEA